MLTNYEKFRVVDENKNNEFFLEVNWNEKDPKSNECKLVKFTFPNGETCIVRRDILMGILWTFGTPEQQRKMIPQTISKVRWYETVIKVKPKNQKEMAEQLMKGDGTLTFPIRLSLPPIEEEVIRDIVQSQGFKKTLLTK